MNDQQGFPGVAARRFWRWSTGDVSVAAYTYVRIAVAVGSIMCFASWAASARPGALIRYQPVNTVAPDSSLWWMLLAIGALGAGLLGAGRFMRPSALATAAALQACGGIVANWAPAALTVSAVALAVALPFTGDAAMTREVPAWPLRFVQLQLPFGYLLAVLLKLSLTEQWRTLTAFRHMMVHPMNVHRGVHLPLWAGSSFDLMGLSLEFLAGALLLTSLLSGSNRTRVCGLVLSAALHIGISLLIPVGLFFFGVAPLWVAHLRTPPQATRARTWWWATAWVAVAALMLTGGALLGPGNPFTLLR
jgi:hypothetical protein